MVKFRCSLLIANYNLNVPELADGEDGFSRVLPSRPGTCFEEFMLARRRNVDTDSNPALVAYLSLWM